MLKYTFKLLLLLAASLLAITSHGQKWIDSLENELSVVEIDSQKIEIWNRLASHYRRNPQKKDIAKEYLQNAIKLGGEREIYSQLARSYDLLGVIQRDAGEYPQAIDNHTKALEIAEDTDNKIGQMYALNNLGVVHRRINNLEVATNLHLKALKIAEETENLRSISIVINSLGNVYLYLKNYEEAIKYFKRGLDIAKQRDNELGMAINLNNIGGAHMQQKDYETALIFFLESLKLNQKINSAIGMAICYNDAGYCYKQLGDPTKALSFFQKALEYITEVGDINILAYTNINLGSVYIDLNNENLAIKYLQEGLEQAKSIGAKDHTQTGLERLSEAYKQSGQFNKALVAYQESILYKDSIYNEETSQNISQMQAKFETEKKEAEIEYLTEKNKSTQDKLEAEERVMFALYVIIGLSVILLLTLYRKERQKHQNNQVLLQMNEEIQSQNDQIQIQSAEIHLKNENITDSIRYAKRIQNAILGEEHTIIEQIKSTQNGNTHIIDGFIFYQPRDIVSGDFYWYAEVILENETKPVKVFIVADCTGHGVPGAFMTMMGNALLNEIVVEQKIIDPATILYLLDEKVQATLNKEGASKIIHDGMDMSVLVIDDTKEVLYYAGAKNPLWYISKVDNTDKIIQLKGSHSTIGKSTFSPNKFFETHSLDMNNISTCYLFSDGFKDQFGGENNRKFMSKRFRALLLANSKLPMQEQKEKLKKEISQWKGEQNQTDDMLVAGLQFR